jgi:hypothetical protein
MSSLDMIFMIAFAQELGEELDDPEGLLNGSAAGCFTRTALPPEQQWSDIPAAGQQDVKYFRGALAGSPVSTSAGRRAAVHLGHSLALSSIWSCSVHAMEYVRA